MEYDEHGLVIIIGKTGGVNGDIWRVGERG
jgi:hypothetical protein